MSRNYLVVTSISKPNEALNSLAQGAKKHAFQFLVVGDEKSPGGFTLNGCRYFDLASQGDLPFQFARACPAGNYARKNIGDLVALSEGANVIVETDDDNFPLPEFWQTRTLRCRSRSSVHRGWVNVYRYFSDQNIWPRGFPLDEVRNIPVKLADEFVERDCPIQQGLADENPDVDALYRLTQPLPLSFRKVPAVSLSKGCWCPFNSQNTTWWRQAAPLMYLPSYCSFRMTDIWRSLVAQRIAWENGWEICFLAPTVRQERNEHDLMKDFEEEIPGYLYNGKIVAALQRLDLKSGPENMPSNLLQCYRCMISLGVIEDRELHLLDIWLNDLKMIEGQPR